MRLSGLFPVVAVVSAFWLLPVEAARAVHFLGHGLDTQSSSGQQIDEFCKQYPALAGSPNTTPEQRQKYKKLYRQHCDRSAAGPTKPVKPIKPAMPDEEPGTTPQPRLGRIERIQPPACLGRGSEIHVRGSNLRDGGLDCRLEAGSGRQSLQAYSRTAREFRFRVDNLRPGPDYVLQCDVAGDRERISLKGCDSPGTPGGTADVDLAAEIRAGVLRPGETQMIEVLIPNRGRSRAPRNERYRVMLALVDRDLTRTAGMTMGRRETLVEKSQWATRLPAAGQSERLSIAINVPGRMPDAGSLHWCAFADHEGQIPELNERNNLACIPASGGSQVVARDDLSKLFGSAVRNRGPGVPDKDRVIGENDASSSPRTMMYDGDSEDSAIAGEAPEGIQETATADGIGLDFAALEARAAELPAVQGDNETLPGFEAGSLADRGLGSRADAIEQANQARGLEDLTEVIRGGLGVPGFEGGEQDPLKPGGVDLANRDTGNPLDDALGNSSAGDDDANPYGGDSFMPEPTAPQGREGGTPNAGKGANPLRPSMNPRDWASGARSQDDDGSSGGGEVIQMDPVEIDTSGTSVRKERGANGSTITIFTRTEEDGSTFLETRTEDRNGEWLYTRQIRTDSDNNVVMDRTRGRGEPRWQRGPMDPAGNPDPNNPGYDEAFARWHSQFDHSKKKGAPIINRVNPGPDGATPNPKGPRLRVPEHQLTGNPSPEAWGGGERPLTRAEAERFQEELLEKMRGPSGGGHPGDERGDAIERP